MHCSQRRREGLAFAAAKLPDAATFPLLLRKDFSCDDESSGSRRMFNPFSIFALSKRRCFSVVSRGLCSHVLRRSFELREKVKARKIA